MTESMPPQGRLPLTVVLLAIAIGGALDLLLDAPTEWRSLHVVYELGLVAAGLLNLLGMVDAFEIATGSKD